MSEESAVNEKKNGGGFGDLLAIFASFAKTGAVAYGGGPSMVPVLKAEMIERRKWIDTDSFMDVLAIANALPGPLITKLAAAVGFARSGVLGAIAALLGMILPSAVALLILLGFVSLVKDNPLVAYMLTGIRPVVVAMLAYAAWDMAPNAVKGGATLAIFAAALALMMLTPVHPALIVVAGAFVGILLRL